MTIQPHVVETCGLQHSKPWVSSPTNTGNGSPVTGGGVLCDTFLDNTSVSRFGAPAEPNRPEGE